MLLRKILAHSCIVLGGMFLTFSIINYFNDAMNFIGNDISLTLLFIWSVLSHGNRRTVCKRYVPQGKTRSRPAGKRQKQRKKRRCAV